MVPIGLFHDGKKDTIAITASSTLAIHQTMKTTYRENNYSYSLANEHIVGTGAGLTNLLLSLARSQLAAVTKIITM
jgi:hypothetical protein